MKQILCQSIDDMEKVIKKLHEDGYSCEGVSLHNVGKAAYEWKRGMRIVNVYSSKEVKFAAKPKKE